MRKFIIFIFASIITNAVIFSTEGCSEKKGSNDSIADTLTKADTSDIDTIDNLISEAPMPKAADELFDDFFFNFAANRKLQLHRIVFPLPEFSSQNVTYLEKGQWKMDHFFMRQDFYTLIFDNEKQLKLVKDTSVSNVIVEKITFSNSTVRQYVFNRIKGQWMLTQINNKPMYENNNSSFLRFYSKFVSDSAFQMRSISNPLKFVGPDPDDDFGTITGTIVPEQWPSFAPEMPKNKIYNIIYGQKYSEGNKKIFVIRGIANGLETELTFVRLAGKWKLVKLST